MDVALGALVKDLRKRNKLSQSELGKALDVSFQQIQKYERGTNRISFSALTKIAGVFGCTASDLVSRVDGSQPMTPGDQFNNDLSELMQVYSSIKSPEMRQAVLNLAKAAADDT